MDGVEVVDAGGVLANKDRNTTSSMTGCRVQGLGPGLWQKEIGVIPVSTTKKDNEP